MFSSTDNPTHFPSQFCLLLDDATKTTQWRIVREIELTGAPYSVGDAPGQGVRLVLGTDRTVSQDWRSKLDTQ